MRRMPHRATPRSSKALHLSKWRMRQKASASRLRRKQRQRHPSRWPLPRHLPRLPVRPSRHINPRQRQQPHLSRLRQLSIPCAACHLPPRLRLPPSARGLSLRVSSLRQKSHRSSRRQRPHLFPKRLPLKLRRLPSRRFNLRQLRSRHPHLLQPILSRPSMNQRLARLLLLPRHLRHLRPPRLIRLPRSRRWQLPLQPQRHSRRPQLQ